MLDTKNAALIIRITGVTLSISSAVVLFIQPLQPVTNTLAVYCLLIAAAMFVMMGQLITIHLYQPSDYMSPHKRHEAIYDALTIGGVMILFVVFYVVPFIQQHT